MSCKHEETMIRSMYRWVKVCSCGADEIKIATDKVDELRNSLTAMKIRLKELEAAEDE